MSSERFVQNHLRKLPLFERLSPEQLELVAKAFQVVRYEPGHLVFQQGQPTRGMLVLVSGRGILTRIGTDGQEERVGAVEAGQYINESALYHQGVETASLRIVEETVALFLDHHRFLQLLIHNPEIRTNLRVNTAPDMRQTPRKFFRGQRDDETVLHIFRHHWWSFARHSWLAIVLVLLLWIIAALVGSQNPAIGLAAAAMGFIAPGLLVIYWWFEWQNDYLVITDQRVVRIWRDVLRFENIINEIPLERIIEVNVELPPADVFARLFTYGTISIRTAGDVANLNLSFMPRPKELQTLIFVQRDRYEQGRSLNTQDSIRADIERALGIPASTIVQQAAEAPGQRREDYSAGLPFIRTRFKNEAGDVYYRKHGTVWLAHIFLPALLVFVSGSVALLSLVSPSFPLYGGVGLSIGFLLFLAGMIWLYIADWDWRNDLLILGQNTISFVKKRPLWLQNELERIRLAQVDNVISDVSGLLDNLLNRGTVRISLLGSDEQKRFGKVFDPEEIQSEVSRRLAQLQSSHQRNEAERQRQAIAEYLAVYHQTVQGQQQPQNAPPFNAPPHHQPTFNTDSQQTVYNPYSPAEQRTQPTEPPPEPPPYRDAVRPPRVPRVLPPDTLPEE